MNYTKDDVEFAVKHLYLSFADNPKCSSASAASIIIDDLESYFGHTEGYYVGLALLIEFLKETPAEKEKELIEKLTLEIEAYQKEGGIK